MELDRTFDISVTNQQLGCGRLYIKAVGKRHCSTFVNSHLSLAVSKICRNERMDIDFDCFQIARLHLYFQVRNLFCDFPCDMVVVIVGCIFQIVRLKTHAFENAQAN